ncbi:hypothetical protein A1359_07305 [Methylomonas lenta]|uniref:Uncharacterized protein n=1 Tax=Methylomonas lenta TaxID=980561 RepID=A0A177NF16_9GAMM|nr:hypothetical protein [Methylomonas lenta]OAI16451.1 hypothetical protein A1359_07305 [Methylomonas lenta]
MFKYYSILKPPCEKLMLLENKQYILDILIEYFNENDWPVYVNKSKLLDRSSIYPNESYPNIKTVKIERHRAVLGDQYREGLGMNAYKTYWMCYSVNELTRKVIDLGEQPGSYSINMAGLVDKHLDYESFSLNIEPLENGLYRVNELTYNLTKEVTSVDDICNCIFEIIPGHVEYFTICIDSEECFSKVEKDKLISDYESELREQLVEKANELWEDRE